jgi:hypothetical protein
MGAILQMRYMENINSALVSRTVPPEIVVALANPARMIEIKLILSKAYGQTASGLENSSYLIDHIKAALVFALNGIFFLGAIFAFLGLMTTLFVQEKKLRSR